MAELQGRVALVSGAGSADGIGFAAARLLLEAGAAVALSATTERIHQRAAELGGDPAQIFACPADLTAEGQAAGLVAAVLSRFGRLDILVNNAGMVQSGTAAPSGARFEALDFAAWSRDIELNLNTCFHLTRAALPAMLARGYGRIVNIASVTGPLVAVPGLAGYSAAKAAMVGLTRALAVEVAAQGVTVNAVAPGWIATGSSTAEELAAGRHTPIGRPGTPEEIAHVVRFLAGPGSSYLTGQMIVVDGGNALQEIKGPTAG